MGEHGEVNENDMGLNKWVEHGHMGWIDFLFDSECDSIGGAYTIVIHFSIFLAFGLICMTDESINFFFKFCWPNIYDFISTSQSNLIRRE